MPTNGNHDVGCKVYGYSDDLVDIDRLDGSNIDEIGCFERIVEVRFKDGTIIHVQYPKRPGLGVWGITYINKGPAEQELTECEDEDADLYSDVLVIHAELEEVFVRNKE